MGIVAWIVVGALAGFIANAIMGTREGLIGTVVLGIVGALVGGFLAEYIVHRGSVNGINVESVVIAVIGAIVAVLIWRAIAPRRAVL